MEVFDTAVLEKSNFQTTNITMQIENKSPNTGLVLEDNPAETDNVNVQVK